MEKVAIQYGYKWDGRGSGAYIWSKEGTSRRKRLGMIRIGSYGIGLPERIRARKELETRIIKTLQALEAGGTEREQALHQLNQELNRTTERVVLERSGSEDNGQTVVYAMVQEQVSLGRGEVEKRVGVGMAFHDTTETSEAWRAHFEESTGLESVSADTRDNLLGAIRGSLGLTPPARDASRGGEVPLPARGGRPQPAPPAPEVSREGPAFSV